MKNQRIVRILLLFVSCIILGLEIAVADPDQKGVYVARDGARSEFSADKRTIEFLKSNVPDGVKEQKIVWNHWVPPSRPYASQESIQIGGGFIITSTLYMKNTIRIISVSKKGAEDIHSVVYYQNSWWMGGHIEADEATGGVKMAIDTGKKSFVRISSVEGKLNVRLPKAQQDGADQPTTAPQSNASDDVTTNPESKPRP